MNIKKKTAFLSSEVFVAASLSSVHSLLHSYCVEYIGFHLLTALWGEVVVASLQQALAGSSCTLLLD